MIGHTRETRAADHRRIPSLDGLRAVAILLVIVAHLSQSGTAPWLGPLWRLDVGNLGVRIFFVISGFLITTLLLDEYSANGGVSLRRFYFRRTLRIFPAYYLFLAAMTVAAAAGLIALPAHSIVAATLYVTDYVPVAWWVGHSWSLAIEEQFYLLWPGAIALLGVRRAVVGAALFLLAAPIARTVAASAGHWPDNPRYSFECVADAIAVGCLLARFRGRLWTWTPYRRWLEARAMVFWPLVILAVTAMSVRSPVFAAAVGVTALNVAIAMQIDWCLRNAGSVVGRLLNAPPVTLVGTLSYSLYLWQQPFLREHAGPRFPINVLCISAAAAASYYLVERPVLRARGRLERRLFPPRPPGGLLSDISLPAASKRTPVHTPS